jgi:hypothetical protein
MFILCKRLMISNAATHHRRARRGDHGRWTGSGNHFWAAVHCWLLGGRERRLVMMIVVGVVVVVMVVQSI